MSLEEVEGLEKAVKTTSSTLAEEHELSRQHAASDRGKAL